MTTSLRRLTRRWLATAGLGCALAMTLASCTDGTSPDGRSPAPIGHDLSPSDPATSTAAPAAYDDHLVVIGDSTASTSYCTDCRSFADLYADRIGEAKGVTVGVTDLAIPNAQVIDLIKSVRTDPYTRSSLKAADVVVVTIGFNDTPWNRLDDPCHAAPWYPRIRWAKITPSCTARVTAEYEHQLDRLLSLIVAQRDGHRLMLRVTTVYNNVIADHFDPGWDSPTAVAPSILADAEYTDAECRVAERHGGACARMGPLMNGPSGAENADRFLSEHTHMNQRGHSLTAAALWRLGLDFTAH